MVIPGTGDGMRNQSFVRGSEIKKKKIKESEYKCKVSKEKKKKKLESYFPYRLDRGSHDDKIEPSSCCRYSTSCRREVCC